MSFSILTPTYQQGQFLERNIQSVLNQNVPGVEHIIIDGGSTDTTIDLLKQYDRQLHYWVSEPDAGQADALNKALAQATGEYIGWLNADEYYEPDIFGAIHQAFQNHPRAVLVYGDYRRVTETGKTIRITRSWRFDPDVCRIQTPIIMNCAAFFRRSRVLAAGGFDARYHYIMDWDLILRVMAGNQHWVRLRRVLANFIMHPSSKSVSQGGAFLTEIRAMRKKLYPELTDAEIEALRRRQYRRMMWHMLLDGALFEKIWFKTVAQRHFAVYHSGSRGYSVPVLTKLLDWIDPV